jgi:hypothetical protein
MKPNNIKLKNETPMFNGGSNGINLTLLALHSRTMQVIWGI